MKNTIIIGIDVGSNGSLASNSNGLIEVWRFNKAGESVEDALKVLVTRALEEDWDILACVEKVNATPQMGVTSAFTFGENKGRVYGALRALNVPFEEVLPRTWQIPLNLPKPPPRTATKQQKQAYKLQHKRDLYEKAKNLFPYNATTMDTADALLIMKYCEDRMKGNL